MKNKSIKVLLVIVIVIIALGAGVVIWYTFSSRSGHDSLEAGVDVEIPIIEQNEELTEKETAKWQEGWVKYNGEIYQYKKDVMTFLLMGTDQTGKNTAQSGSLDGGQADVQVLVVLDFDEKRIELIPINRNTMVDVDVYDELGNVIRTQKAQIAVQHGVGNGMEESCEYQVKAVSRFLFQIPIYGYASMSLEGLAPLSNAIGGVDVTVPADELTEGLSFHKGETIHLSGNEALNFVRERDHDVGGADRRLERQKVFMKALISRVLKSIKEDPKSVISIYSSAAKYMTTDIDTNEMIYLAGKSASLRYDGSSMHSIAGETVRGEDFDEFYADETALKELILNIFYEKIEIDNG